MPVGLGRKLADCLGVEALWPSGSGSSQSEREHFRGYIPDLLHTDVEVTATRRAEQRYLRASLLAGGNTRCALCRRQLPPELLVAAHIKPRAECTPTERVDFRAAAMLACTLGCDALFEYGYVAVDADGVINTATPGHPDLDDVLERLRGTVCLAHSTATAANFQSHWASRFRGQRSAVVRKRRAPPQSGCLLTWDCAARHVSRDGHGSNTGDRGLRAARAEEALANLGPGPWQ
jgi:hypothetical protein